MLHLHDEWVWDSWVADDGERHHLFFLRAPRSLQDPDRRHLAAGIGHATSTDLVHWEDHGVALAPTRGPGFDDGALWTGSVARGDDGVWRLYYTAISRVRGVRDQRLGLAESDDLMTWRRAPGARLPRVDPRWYRTLPEDDSASETWRDPFVFGDPGGDGWHMLICARDRDAPRRADGVLAHARSADMRAWELGPPLSRPAGFGQLEVPQVHDVDGRALLLFTCHPDEQSDAQRRRHGGGFCTWMVAGDALTGPWDVARARPFEAEPSLFAAPLVRARDGGLALLGFRNRESEGVLELEIVDPIPVRLGRDGVLVPIHGEPDAVGWARA